MASLASSYMGTRAVPFCTGGARKDCEVYTREIHVEIFLTTAASQTLSMWLVLDHLEYAFYGKAHVWLVFESTSAPDSELIRDLNQTIRCINGIRRMGYNTKIHMRLSRSLLERMPGLELRDDYTNERVKVFRPCEEYDTSPAYAIFFTIPNGILSIMITTHRGEEIKAYYSETISYISRSVFSDQCLVYENEYAHAMPFVARFMAAFRHCFWVDLFTLPLGATSFKDMLLIDWVKPEGMSSKELVTKVFQDKGDQMLSIYRRILAETKALKDRASSACSVYRNNPVLLARGKMLLARHYSNGDPFTLPAGSLILAAVFVTHLKDPTRMGTFASPYPVVFTPTGEMIEGPSNILILHGAYFPAEFKGELTNVFWNLLGGCNF